MTVGAIVEDGGVAEPRLSSFASNKKILSLHSSACWISSNSSSGVLSKISESRSFRTFSFSSKLSLSCAAFVGSAGVEAAKSSTCV